MTKQPIVPAILIGGAGTRLWPLSRANKPKQFLRLFGENSLFQDTVLRFVDPAFGRPWLLSSAETLHHARGQLAEQGNSAAGVVIEPLMRGTAAALAALALVVARTDPETLVLAAPADHVISHPDRFRHAVKRAAPLAQSGLVVTFGIKPTAPETGFGYIRGAKPLRGGDAEVLGYSIDAGGFLEKPTRDRAETFIGNGYFWNAGIFLFKASALVAEFERHAPDTLDAARASIEAGQQTVQGDTPYWHLDADAFAEAPADLSIDNAIMEITERAAVVPCTDIGWSDVGSLSALWDIARDHDGANVVHGDALLLETTGSLVYSHGNRKVVTSHLADMIIVDTEDCVVVLPREQAQEVKTIVKTLKAGNSPEVNYFREAAFDWGRMKIVATHDDATTAEVELLAQNAFGPRTVVSERERWIVTRGSIFATVNGHGAMMERGAVLSLDRGDLVTIEAMAVPVDCVVVFAAPSGSTPAHLVASGAPVTAEVGGFVRGNRRDGRTVPVRVDPA